MTSCCGSSVVAAGPGPGFGSHQQAAGLGEAPGLENGPLIKAVKIHLA